MGHWFVIECRSRSRLENLRAEFLRRYWNEQEERAAAGQALRLYPFDR